MATGRTFDLGHSPPQGAAQADSDTAKRSAKSTLSNGFMV